MTPRPLVVGEIVQVDPEVDTFGGCLVVVTEPKAWGCQGYTQEPGQEGQAYVRLVWDVMEPTGGHATWVIGIDPGDLPEGRVVVEEPGA